MHPISIMQGRLSKGADKRLQFFPTSWREEFPLAKKMGFSGITWFLDIEIPGFDPIIDIWGNKDVLEEIDTARAILPIHSIDTGRYAVSGAGAERTRKDFPLLLKSLAGRLRSNVVSIALLEENAPKTMDQKKEACETLQALIAVAEPLGLHLALETEMPVDELASFIDSFQSSSIGVCYDIGNCTSYGFDCPEDIIKLGAQIFEVHLKDRKKAATQSMLLGTGDADFPACFSALKQIDYAGGYTMQAWRGEEYLKDAQNQLDFIKKI